MRDQEIAAYVLENISFGHKKTQPKLRFFKLIPIKAGIVI
jgi:hypothetical protein